MAKETRILGNFDTYVKEYVTIHRPMPSIFPRGKNAPEVNHLRANPIGVRIPNRDRAVIEQACTLLGMTKNDFIRWCAAHVAHDILKQHNEYMKLK